MTQLATAAALAPQTQSTPWLRPQKLTINEVEFLRETWLSALASIDRVQIDTSALEVVDAAGVQLLIALGREAHQRGRPLERVGTVAPALAAATAAAGLDRPVAGDNDLTDRWWLTRS